MRVLVTGAGNQHGEAIVRSLAAAGHHVRAFGIDAGDDRFAGVDNVKPFPGWVEIGGSIEPVLSEREVLVHAACLDAPGKNKGAHANKIDKGTLYAVYAAEREQVDHFLHVVPAKASKTWSDALANARKYVDGTRGRINVRVVDADDAAGTAEAVAALVKELPVLGSISGGNDNAVTA